MRLKFLSIVILAITLITTGCNKKPKAGDQTETTTTTSISEGSAVSQAAVAYVNMDSLISNYAMYYDLKSQFEEKSKKVEADLNNKGRNFERDMKDYQEKVQKGLVTRSQAADMEAQLQTKQQTIMQFRDKSVAELGEQEQVMMNNIYYSITEYLKEFNKDLRYGVILSTTANGPILNANPDLDITSLVVKGLNEQYKTTQNTKK